MLARLLFLLLSALSSCSCLNRGKEPEEEEELLGIAGLGAQVIGCCFVCGKREPRQLRSLYMRTKQAPERGR